MTPDRRGEAEDLTDEEYRRLASFRSALRRFLRFSEDAAREAGLTPQQHQLLLAARGWPGDGDPTVGTLADMLQLRHHSTVELVRRAEDAGLVAVNADPDDRRRQLVSPTPRGLALLSTLTILHRDELRRLRDELAAALDL